MWTTLKADSHYEILTEEPFTIRKIKNKREVSLYKENSGYMRTNLSGKKYLFHVLLARQFIENPNPEQYKYVDHINRNKLDNSLANLRWTTSKGNCLNKSSSKRIEYEYVKELPEGSIPVESYGNHRFDNYYYHDDVFYFFNEVAYKKLYVNKNKFVNVKDTNNKYTQICIRKFKRLYGFDKQEAQLHNLQSKAI